MILTTFFQFLRCEFCVSRNSRCSIQQQCYCCHHGSSSQLTVSCPFRFTFLSGLFLYCFCLTIYVAFHMVVALALRCTEDCCFCFIMSYNIVIFSPVCSPLSLYSSSSSRQESRRRRVDWRRTRRLRFLNHPVLF